MSETLISLGGILDGLGANAITAFIKGIPRLFRRSTPDTHQHLAELAGDPGKRPELDQFIRDYVVAYPDEVGHIRTLIPQLRIEGGNHSTNHATKAGQQGSGNINYGGMTF